MPSKGRDLLWIEVSGPTYNSAAVYSILICLRARITGRAVEFSALCTRSTSVLGRPQRRVLPWSSRDVTKTGANIHRNVLPDETNMTNIIVTGIWCYIYLSLCGLLSNLKLEFVTYLQLMFCLLLVQHKQICSHPGTAISQTNFRFGCLSHALSTVHYYP